MPVGWLRPMPLIALASWLSLAPASAFAAPFVLRSADATITVTTTSDELNGDASSVASLRAGPGPDGISLREAVTATNNSPGTYTIRFDQALKGSSITVGPGGHGDLPPLTGGGLTIDGDIDGDDRPDVTLVSEHHDSCRCGWGLNLVSSGNQIQNLTLRGFDNGIHFTPKSRLDSGPVPAGKTFANNAVSGVTLTDIGRVGILFKGQCESACRTSNRWLDTRIVGNTITAGLSGIEVELNNTVGDVFERLTIQSNNIAIGASAIFGINLSAGGGGGADRNRISDTVVADNVIEGLGYQVGIMVFSGLKGGSANVVEDLKIERNRVRFSAPARANGIKFALGDGCTDDKTICSVDNIARRIQIVGNTLEGHDEAGIAMSSPCCGVGFEAEFADIQISRNVLKGVVTSAHANPWGVVIGGRKTTGVVIDSNTIEQRTLDPGAVHAAYLGSGGIAITAGLGAWDVSLRSITITNNRIDTDVAGITILAGGTLHYGEAPVGGEHVTANTVSDVTIRGNTIPRAPTLLMRWYPGIKGISVIGGLGPAPGAHFQHVRGNTVRSITLEGNQVAGVADDVSVLSNFGSATENLATLGLEPPVLTISRSGTGTGIVRSAPARIDCGSTCSRSFEDRTQVTLTATPAPGSTFTGWSGGGCSGTGACTITLTTSTEVQATFAAQPTSVPAVTPTSGAPGLSSPVPSPSLAEQAGGASATGVASSPSGAEQPAVASPSAAAAQAAESPPVLAIASIGVAALLALVALLIVRSKGASLRG